MFRYGQTAYYIKRIILGIIGIRLVGEESDYTNVVIMEKNPISDKKLKKYPIIDKNEFDYVKQNIIM